MSTSPYDLIALGETMLALVPPSGGSLRTADALLVDHAGAESNTCVGLARLGFQVAWISRLGVDAAGDRVLGALAAEGVDTRFVRRDPDRPTGLMVKEPGARVRYCRDGSAASAMEPDDLTGVPLPSARAVLVTGVTALIGPGPHAAGLALLAAARGLRIVDPNLRAGLWGSDRRVELVRMFVERCDLLLAGAGELSELLGDAAPRTQHPAPGTRETLEPLARRAAACGPREVVVRGSVRVGVLVDLVWREIDITRELVIDPIGAGDAFNAGYAAVRLRGGSPEDALRAGVRCGVAVTTAPSDTSAFPRSL